MNFSIEISLDICRSCSTLQAAPCNEKNAPVSKDRAVFTEDRREMLMPDQRAAEGFVPIRINSARRNSNTLFLYFLINPTLTVMDG